MENRFKKIQDECFISNLNTFIYKHNIQFNYKFIILLKNILPIEYDLWFYIYLTYKTPIINIIFSYDDFIHVLIPTLFNILLNKLNIRKRH